MIATSMELAAGLLRTLRSEDAPELAALANDRNIWLNVRDTMPYPYTLSDAHTFIDSRVQDPPLDLAIIQQGKLVGVIGATGGKDVEHRTAEVGYWIGAPYQNAGMATAALMAFIPYLFGTCSFTRLQACVFEGNPMSMRVLEKCGFKEEGVLRKAALKDGKRLDIHLFGLLKEEAPH